MLRMFLFAGLAGPEGSGIAEQTWVDAGLHEAELEMHEQHRVNVVVQALACEGRHGG